MTFRNRIRKWLGIEADAQACNACDLTLGDLIRTLQERCDNIERETQACVSRTAQACDEAKKARVAVGSCSADVLAMFESAKKDTIQLRQDYEAYRTTFFQRMDATEKGIKSKGEEIGFVAGRMIDIEQRLGMAEGRLSVAAVNAETKLTAQKRRAITIVTNYHSSGFRPSHREALIKKIREEA